MFMIGFGFGGGGRNADRFGHAQIGSSTGPFIQIPKAVIKNVIETKLNPKPKPIYVFPPLQENERTRIHRIPVLALDEGASFDYQPYAADIQQDLLAPLYRVKYGKASHALTFTTPDAYKTEPVGYAYTNRAVDSVPVIRFRKQRTRAYVAMDIDQYEALDISVPHKMSTLLLCLQISTFKTGSKEEKAATAKWMRAERVEYLRRTKDILKLVAKAPIKIPDGYTRCAGIAFWQPIRGPFSSVAVSTTDAKAGRVHLFC